METPLETLTPRNIGCNGGPRALPHVGLRRRAHPAILAVCVRYFSQLRAVSYYD
jgi:hypothetical protein